LTPEREKNRSNSWLEAEPLCAKFFWLIQVQISEKIAWLMGTCR
jgi:hypothetical protein